MRMRIESMFGFKTVFAAAIVALLGIGSVQSAQAADITLSYAFYAPSSTFPAAQMRHWKKEVEKRTDSKVAVQLYSGGSLLGATDMYDGVLNGVADIGLGTPTYDPGRFPLAYGMSLPLGFPNATAASKTYWKLMQEFKPKAFDQFKIIALFTTEPGYLQTRKPIRSLEDIQGAKLRGTGPLFTALKKLGADPVAMPMSDVPQAIQTGVIDGILTSREILKDLKLADSLHYVTDYPTGVYAFAAVMSKDRWKKLPDSVKKVINDLAPKMSTWTGHFHDNEVQDAMSWAENEKGLKMVELKQGQEAKWNARMKTIVQSWLDDHAEDDVPARKFLKRLKELKGKYTTQDKEGKL